MSTLIVAAQLEVLRPAAEEAGIKLIEAPADNAAELDKFFKSLPGSGDTGFDAILLLAEPLAVTPDAFLVLAKFASEHKMPFGGAFMEIQGYASLFGVNIDTVTTGKQAAILADNILKGADVSTIPVISSEKFLELSLKETEKLGLKVSDNIISQANKVIR